MPAWSPQDDLIAYVSEPNAASDRLTSGNISVLEITGKDSFGGVTLIHTAADLQDQPEGGVADSYPTWSPEAHLLAFAHGTGSRSEVVDNKLSALYTMAADGSELQRLNRANSGNNDDFQPNFSPFDEGGYYWLTFLSRRDYGNDLAGTQGTNRQQIWVAAVKKDAAPGEDPSEVAYWLPGQSTESKNISAFWAPRACRADGEGCSVGSECCGGECAPGSDGALVCSPPPPERCRQEAETCSSSDDCCNGAECRNNVCSGTQVR